MIRPAFFVPRGGSTRHFQGWGGDREDAETHPPPSVSDTGQVAPPENSHPGANLFSSAFFPQNASLPGISR